jgi:hypothetical protein
MHLPPNSIKRTTGITRRALGPSRPPTPAVKRPGHEADHFLPSSAEVKNLRSCISLLQYVFMVWCSVKHRDNFTFTLLVSLALYPLHFSLIFLSLCLSTCLWLMEFDARRRMTTWRFLSQDLLVCSYYNDFLRTKRIMNRSCPSVRLH